MRVMDDEIVCSAVAAAAVTTLTTESTARLWFASSTNFFR